MRPLIALLFLMPSMAGCFGQAPPLPRDHYYRILVPDQTAEGASPVLAGVISVPPLEADGLLRERPLLFSASGAAYEMQQHDYHHWSDSPTRMLQGELARYLRQSRFGETVVTSDIRIRPDFEVVGRIKRLERLLGSGTPRVAAELELALIDLADNRMLVLDTYSIEQSSRGGSVEASVLALNRAVADIFGRFLEDARQTSLAKRPDPD